MSTKDQVLKVLEENKGQSISGEKLAMDLNKSRAAVWKAVNELRKQGYSIHAEPNKGYSLAENSDILSCQAMMPYVGVPLAPEHIHVFSSVESTNDTLKQMALNGAEPGTIVLAEQQTKGKGRRGRSFLSPSHTGIYMSILLKPDLEISKSVLITTAASVAVCRAIKKVANIETQIKWVNDIYYQSKKICGILTEAVTDFESGQIQYIVLGIGINCALPKEGVPEELFPVLGALNIAELSRNRLAAEVYNQVMLFHETLDQRSFIAEYRKRCLVLGKRIRIYEAGAAPTGGIVSTDDSQPFLTATALDIGNDGQLIVEYEDGTVASLSSGEISIRL